MPESRPQRQEKLDALAGRLHRLATETVGRRQPLENRWVDDFRMLEGRYTPQEESNLDKLEQSKAFANQTRPKTDAAIARLLEILAPQDEDIFDIQPTPSPVLMSMQGSDAPTEITDPQTGQQVTENQVAQRVRMEAKKRARRMKELIKDEMLEADWPIVMRQMITSGCEYGTGVVKGPIVQGKVRTAWLPRSSDDGSVIHEIDTVMDLGAGLEYVNLWNFFPDMSATRMEEASFVFIRHRYNKMGLRELAKQPGFDEEVIAEIIEAGPWHSDTDSAFGLLREVTGVHDQWKGEFWETWEFHGHIDDDDLEAAELIKPRQRDPLRGVLGEVWFSNGRTMKMSINPLEPQSLPFSVFNYDPDPTCILGRGIPHRIRHSQRSANAAWRMMHDNGALSAGGQIIMDKSVTKAPQYGGASDRKMTPRAVWLKSDPLVPIQNVFGQFTFDGQLQSLQMLYQMARQLIDEESGFPALVAGDAQSNIAQNATGLTVLSNLALTLMRRPVRNFDDEVTNRLVTAFYNWNMAHSPDPDIKGDYAVIVRGSKYLVTKEIRAQNAVWLAQQVMSNPQFAQFADPRKAFRALVHAAQHEPAEWMMAEALMEDEESAPQQGQPSPEEQAASAEQQQMQVEAQMKQAELQLEQAKLQLKQLEIQQKEQESIRETQLKLAEIATQQGITVEQARQNLAIEAMKDVTKNREMDIRLQTGEGI